MTKRIFRVDVFMLIIFGCGLGFVMTGMVCNFIIPFVFPVLRIPIPQLELAFLIKTFLINWTWCTGSFFWIEHKERKNGKLESMVQA